VTDRHPDRHVAVTSTRYAYLHRAVKIVEIMVKLEERNHERG